MSEELSVRFSLLDHQIIDAERRPVGRVDDLELRMPSDGGAPEIKAVLTGAEALGQRIGGVFGCCIASVGARLRPSSAPTGPARVEATLINQVEPLVQLSVPLRDLPQVAGLERWLAHHVIEPLPGAGDARE